MSAGGHWDWDCSDWGPGCNRFMKKPWRLDTNVTASGQKCLSCLIPLVRTNHMAYVGNAVELRVQEDETGLVSIKPDVCRTCYLALLVLLTLTTKLFSMFLSSAQSKLLPFSIIAFFLPPARDPLLGIPGP